LFKLEILTAVLLRKFFVMCATGARCCERKFCLLFQGKTALEKLFAFENKFNAFLQNV
jgi:hypothetical protein